jgi:hypothetical protein
MSNITDAEFIAEVNQKRTALKPGHAVVAVMQTMYPQYGTYTVLTNTDKRRALALLMERSASKASGRGKLRQIAFYFERGRGNQLWQTFCSFVRSVAAGVDRKSLGTVTDVSDILAREIEL